jgi:hypothetical protein
MTVRPMVTFSSVPADWLCSIFACSYMTQIIRLETPELKSEMTLRWGARSAHPMIFYRSFHLSMCDEIKGLDPLL